MKKLAVATLAFVLVGCGSKQEPAPAPAPAAEEIAALRNAIEDVRAQVAQANENARIARELAEQNAEKINRGYRAGQRK